MAIRNRRARDLFYNFQLNPPERWRTLRDRMIADYKAHRDPRRIQAEIDQIIERSTNSFENPGEYSLVVSEKRDPATGRFERQYFSALDGQFHRVQGRVTTTSVPPPSPSTSADADCFLRRGFRALENSFVRGQ